jgi:uncharacterized membrane protein
MKPEKMMSQNRQAKLSERRNHLDLQINMLAEQETTEILRLLRLLCEHSGVGPAKCDNGRAFEAETKHAEIVRQIQNEIEEQAGDTEAAEDRAGEPPAPANGSKTRQKDAGIKFPTLAEQT